MKSQSYVFPLECLKVNKREEGYWILYITEKMWLCKRTKRRIPEEEVFISFLQAHSSALLPGALSNSSPRQRLEELVSNEPELNPVQGAALITIPGDLKEQCLFLPQGKREAKHKQVSIALQAILICSQSWELVSLYHPSGVLVSNTSVQTVLKPP